MYTMSKQDVIFRKRLSFGQISLTRDYIRRAEANWSSVHSTLGHFSARSSDVRIYVYLASPLSDGEASSHLQMDSRNSMRDSEGGNKADIDILTE
jgi:hypothetical protein